MARKADAKIEMKCEAFVRFEEISKGDPKDNLIFTEKLNEVIGGIAKEILSETVRKYGKAGAKPAKVQIHNPTKPE